MSTLLDTFLFLGILAILGAGLILAHAGTPAAIFLGGCVVLLALCFVLVWDWKGRR